jgi:hypothetical protein
VLSNSRRIELISALVAVVVAATIALLAEPLPPLLEATDDEWWARGIEFSVITFALWMALSVVGFMRGKIAVGPGGVTAERVAALEQRENEASAEAHQASAALTARVEQLVGVVSVLEAQQRESVRRIDRIYEIGAPGAAAQRGLAEGPPEQPEAGDG